jgi:hypothetical protein
MSLASIWPTGPTTNTFFRAPPQPAHMKSKLTCPKTKVDYRLILGFSINQSERWDGRVGYGARLRLLLTLLPGHESGVGSSPTLISIRLVLLDIPGYFFCQSAESENHCRSDAANAPGTVIFTSRTARRTYACCHHRIFEHFVQRLRMSLVRCRRVTCIRRFRILKKEETQQTSPRSRGSPMVRCVALWGERR